MEKIVTGYICQIQSVCQKVEESGRDCGEQFHLSSIFLLCIYLALENAGNVFSFRLGPFAKPQKYTGRLLVIVWLLIVQSVLKLVKNIFLPLEVYEKHQQLFVFIFWNLSQEQKKKISFFNWQLLDSIPRGRRPAHYFWPSADPKWFSRIRSYSQMLDVRINNNNNGISDFMNK